MFLRWLSHTRILEDPLDRWLEALSLSSPHINEPSIGAAPPSYKSCFMKADIVCLPVIILHPNLSDRKQLA